MANVRTHVYTAENHLRHLLDRAPDVPTVQFYGSLLTLPIERKFASIESIQDYADKVLSLNWVQETYPLSRSPIRVRVRAGDKNAHYQRSTATIAVPDARLGWAMRELVVLHEIAHHLDNSLEDHGPTFTGILVHLVTEIMSAEAGWLLRTLYYQEGVQVA